MATTMSLLFRCHEFEAFTSHNASAIQLAFMGTQDTTDALHPQNIQVDGGTSPPWLPYPSAWKSEGECVVACRGGVVTVSSDKRGIVICESAEREE